MGTYAFYGILVLCICFIQTFGYERCTYTWAPNYYCDIGFCCYRNGEWDCVQSTYSSNCDSLAHTTTTTTTTTAAPITDAQRMYGTISSIVFVALMAVVVVYYIRYKMKKNRPAPVARSTTIAVIYKV